MPVSSNIIELTCQPAKFVFTGSSVYLKTRKVDVNLFKHAFSCKVPLYVDFKNELKSMFFMLILKIKSMFSYFHSWY